MVKPHSEYPLILRLMGIIITLNRVILMVYIHSASIPFVAALAKAGYPFYQPQVRLDAVKTGGFHCILPESMNLFCFNLLFSLWVMSFSGITIL